MKKKNKIKKLIKQNKRNRIINKKYFSTIKSSLKMFLSLKNNEKNIKSKLINSLYSLFDKATQKGIYHKNTAAKKKSKINNLFLKNFEK